MAVIARSTHRAHLHGTVIARYRRPLAYAPPPFPPPFPPFTPLHAHHHQNHLHTTTTTRCCVGCHLLCQQVLSRVDCALWWDYHVLGSSRSSLRQATIRVCRDNLLPKRISGIWQYKKNMLGRQMERGSTELLSYF